MASKAGIFTALLAGPKPATTPTAIENSMATTKSHHGITEMRVTSSPPHNRFADILNAESTQRRHIDAYRTNRGNQASDHTADKADRTSLAQEHHANIAHIAAKSLHNADFARTFRHRHNHGVGNTNRGNEERHRADAAQSQLDAPRLLFDLLTRLLKRGSLITGALICASTSATSLMSWVCTST